MKLSLFFAFTLTLTGLLTACSQQPAQMAQTQPLDEQPMALFMLAPGDEIEVKFANRPQWNEIVRVRPDGYVDLLQVGSLMAAGLPPEGLAQQIAQEYQRLGGSAQGAAQVNYVLAIGDDLAIRLPYQEGLDQTVKVRPDGRISLPLVGTVMALGKTPEALAEELRAHYAKTLRRPEVNVDVLSFTSLQVQGPLGTQLAGVNALKPSVQLRTPVARQIYIGGEVQKPGALTYRQGLSVLQAVVEAGGLKTVSAGARTMVLRKTPTGTTLIPVDVSTLNSRKVTATADLTLQPFDVVVVPKSTWAVAADSVDAVFNLLPPLRNSSFGLIYQIDPKTNIVR